MLLRFAFLSHRNGSVADEDSSPPLLEDELSSLASSLADGPAAYIESLDECSDGLLGRRG